MKHNLKVFAVAITAAFVTITVVTLFFTYILDLEPNPVRGAITGAIAGVSIAIVASIYYDP